MTRRYASGAPHVACNVDVYTLAIRIRILKATAITR